MMKEMIFADPRVTPFIECPNCQRLLRYGTERCPDCYEEIRQEYAYASAVAVAINTKSCAMANTIRTLDISAVLAVGVTVLTYFLNESDSPILFGPVFWPGIVLLAV